MGYNPEIFVRIREEFAAKAEKARSEADARTKAAELVVPGLSEINSLLASTGIRIMDVIVNHRDEIDERLAKIEEENDALIEKKKKLLEEAGYPADFTEVRYECELCHDSGYANDKMCQCMKTALVLAGYEASGIGSLLREQSFDSFSLDYYKQNAKCYENMFNVFNAVRAYADSFKGTGSGNLAFFGNTGLGKTHLSSAVARQAIENGYDVMYTTAIGMMSDFEYNRFGSASTPEVSPVSRYFECDLLIIDDLGTEISNQFTVTTLYNVIDTRLKTKKPIIISTNLSTDELRKRYWDRITSRIFGEFRLMLFTGTDIRRQKISN